MEKKNLVIVALCVAIGVMAIAYAAFTTTLNVNGTVNAAGTFAVTFQDGAICTGTKVGTDMPIGGVSTTPGTTVATLTAQLYTPGDILTCTIPVKNTGNLRAKYVSSNVYQMSGTTVTSTKITSSSTPIAVSVSSSTGTNAIAANGTSSIVVTITYNWTGNSQPTTEELKFQVQSGYTQAI